MGRLRDSRCCRGPRLCCWIVFSLLLVAITAVLFVLFWVRIPTLNILSITPTGASAAPFTRQDFNLSLRVEMGVKNENFFNLLFDYVEVVGYNSAYDNGRTPIVRGSVGSAQERLKINARSTTNFTLPTVLTYSASKDPTLSFFNYVVDRCVLGNNGKVVDLDLDIDLGFTLIAWTRKAPNVRLQDKLRC
ncbi:hypothetical protein HDU96_005682 [Phlyctochytrium bullatum]|nr:hypothetical protein HDU96_005682 [Phlyctochytrium bullatum]